MSITEMCAVMLAYENGARILVIDKEFGIKHIAEDPTWCWCKNDYYVIEFPEQDCNHVWQGYEGGVYLCSKCGELWVDRGIKQEQDCE